MNFECEPTRNNNDNEKHRMTFDTFRAILFPFDYWLKSDDDHHFSDAKIKHLNIKTKQ